MIKVGTKVKLERDIIDHDLLKTGEIFEILETKNGFDVSVGATVMRHVESGTVVDIDKFPKFWCFLLSTRTFEYSNIED